MDYINFWRGNVKFSRVASGGGGTGNPVYRHNLQLVTGKAGGNKKLEVWLIIDSDRSTAYTIDDLIALMYGRGQFPCTGVLVDTTKTGADAIDDNVSACEFTSASASGFRCLLTMDGAFYSRVLESVTDDVFQVASAGDPYELPKASATTLGGVKVGQNLTIDANGVLSADVSKDDVEAIKEKTGKDVSVDFSVAENHGGNIADSYYGGPYTNFFHYAIPIDERFSSFRLVAHQSYHTRYILTKSYTAPTSSVNTYSECSPLAPNGAKTVVNAGETVDVQLTSDDKFLVIMKRDSQGVWVDVTPQSITFQQDSVFAEKEEVEELKDKIDSYITFGDCLPLGVMDNWITDILNGYGTRFSYFGSGFTYQPLLKENGKIVMVYIRPSFADTTGNNLPQEWSGFLTIKRSQNQDREIALKSLGNATGLLSEKDVAIGKVISQKNISQNVFAVVTDVNDDSFTITLSPSSVNMNTYSISAYTDSSLATFDELIFDVDRCAVFWGNIESSKFDTHRRYYSRSEKLGSKVRGKSAVVFADSLAAFSYCLSHDWGMNIYLMVKGGTRMGYESESDSAWVQNDNCIQTFNANPPESLDFIICAQGSNGTLPETNAEEVAFVINNKRWYLDDAATNPWDSLSQQDKNRFTSTACTYAAFYTLCLKYEGACCVIADVYRTPGPGSTAETWNAEKFSTYLFNGNMIDKKTMLRSMAEKLGAIFVENKTRDSIAAANAYHKTDGVHPPFDVATDWASNIAITIGELHDAPPK